MVGKTISHYQIIEKLGEGGMGVVYKARDAHLDRFVAIKVLPPEKVADPERKRRFVQEAKAASALNHPNIITIYDISSDTGTDFIVMEYVAGKTLDELIPRKGMRLNEALKHSVEIADALAKAHAAGIIHRDLKPGNVMVGEDGRVKVLDFGLAKLTEAAPLGEDEATRTMKPATEEGKIVGTVAYMSPEQAEGKKVDARSDIFSFGSLLYEMVTGRRAFQGKSKLETMAAIMKEEPPPLPVEVPHDLQKLITRCLRKDPDKRFHHMVDVRVALAELKEESDSGKLTPASMVRPTSRRKLIWTAVTLALLAVAGVAAWLLTASRQAPTLVLNPVPLTSFPGYEREPSFSPDGSQVAFSWDGDKQDNFDIYVMLVAGGRPLRLTSDPAADLSPAWSPDGRKIAFLRPLPGGRAAVLQVPPLGGPEQKLAEVYDRPRDVLIGPYLAWSPNGGSLAVADRASSDGPLGLFLLSVETGEKHRLTSPPAEAYRGDDGPAFSVDGSRLVFARVLAAAVSDLHVLALSPNGAPSGEPRPLTFGNWNAASPAWAGNSDVVFASRRRSRDGLWRVAVSSKAEPVRLPFAADEIRTLAVSPRSHRLIYSRPIEDTNIWRVELPSGRIDGPFISSTRLDDRPQFSPDGRRIAFRSLRSRPRPRLPSFLDGSNAIQVTAMGAANTSTPTWSPDGQRIAFASNLEGQYELYVVGAGGGRPQRLTDHPAVDYEPSWSKDGKWISFRSTRSGVYEIWRIPAGPEVTLPKPVQVTRKGGYFPFQSPDEKWFYYMKPPPASGLWRMPVEGGEEVQILEAVAASACAVTNAGVYFMKPSGATAVLQFLDLATRRITSIVGIGKPVSGGLTVSPDRRWVLFSQWDQQGSDLMLVENFR